MYTRTPNPEPRIPSLLLCLILCGLTGCFLFPKGSLDIPPAAKPQYDQGLAFYRQGRFAEAEATFQQVLSADRRAVLARYWLGLSLTQQKKTARARDQFYQIITLSPKLPHGYYGLGLVALQGKHRRFDALDWFREALKRDPTFVDAQWQLALTRLALAQGLFGAFTVGDIRREFERVIKLDPNHP
ncbi:MAG: tetratricopeptide repeat protein, partial [Candidatus Latescibacteria bacterium]|nr:tetratricopeptide repeat protein [Candidatus Latescibacterota bacterium]